MKRIVAAAVIALLLHPLSLNAGGVDAAKLNAVARDLVRPQSKAEREKILTDAGEAIPAGAAIARAQFDELAKVIRKGGEGPKADAGVEDLAVPVQGAKSSFPVQVYTPSGYKKENPAPLLVVMHGGPVSDMGSAKRQQGAAMAGWQPPAEKHGWLLACIAEATDVTGPLGPRGLAEIVDDVKARRNVDPDRVYLSGQSRGGFFSWGYGLQDPDRYAGIAPDCGGMFQGDKLINAANLPVYNIQGKNDNQGNQNYVLPRSARQNKEKLDELQKKEKGKYEHVYKETEMGHVWNAAAYPDAMKWFSARPRNNYVKKVIGHVGHLGGANRLYWLQVVAGQDRPVTGECDREKNEVRIACDGLTKCRVYLHDALLDLDKEIKVFINGKQAFAGKVTRSPIFTLRHIVETNDTGRIFANVLEIEVK